jgi:dihydrofolate synthase/folylpolyglutamate synthase
VIDLSLDRLHFKFRLPKTIHVAGTNGKGSTLAFMKSILIEAGYRVDRYTSPYLWSLNESIEVDGEPVEDFIFEEAFQKYQNKNLTRFEKQTMTAFEIFSQSKSDFLLLETGLGGLFDATNIIKHPFLTAITSISHDHEEFLGCTLEEIAYNKAGIIKPYAPCFVSSCIPLNALAVINRVAQEKKSPLHEAEIYQGEIALQGGYQRYNAGVAVSCLQSFIPDKIIKRAIKKATWIGRMQNIFYKNREILIDGAHNIEGAKALCKELKKDCCAIVAIKSTKNYKGILDILRRHIQYFFYIPVEDGYAPQVLNDYLPGEITATLDEAIDKIPKDYGVVITGSLNLIKLIDKKYFG